MDDKLPSAAEATATTCSGKKAAYKSPVLEFLGMLQTKTQTSLEF